MPHPLKRHLNEPGLRFLVVGLVDISVAARHKCGEEALSLPSQVSEGIMALTSIVDSYCVYRYLVLFC